MLDVSATTLELQCPCCEQAFPFGDTCSRCDVALVDRSRTLVVPKHSSGPIATRMSRMFPLAGVRNVTTAFALVCFLGALAAETLVMTFAFTYMATFFTLTAGVLMLIARSRKRKARSRVIARQARRSDLDVTSLGALPDEADAIRVRGTLHLVVEGEKVIAWVEDEHGVARLPISGKLRVTTIEHVKNVDAIETGHEVEVVGPGRRVNSPGQDYRTLDSSFTFDEGAELDVWV
ncbi:MAG: hypothetical protein DRJ42_12810 [Deltaproteobacteria bacterium]|nr:MAG: hypothetical protein DRJ42_12810 [Deltaproteobacteria bacterium]